MLKSNLHRGPKRARSRKPVASRSKRWHSTAVETFGTEGMNLILGDFLKLLLKMGFTLKSEADLHLLLQKLQIKIQADGPPRGPAVLGGLWAGHRISEEGIRDARKEMWGKFADAS